MLQRRQQRKFIFNNNNNNSQGCDQHLHQWFPKGGCWGEEGGVLFVGKIIYSNQSFVFCFPIEKNSRFLSDCVKSGTTVLYKRGRCSKSLGTTDLHGVWVCVCVFWDNYSFGIPVLCQHFVPVRTPAGEI